jgi:short-subunit dehydrogenase
LAARSYDLVLTARSQDALDRLAAELTERHGIAAQTVVADLAAPNAALALFDRLGATGARVDILINNAGFATFGPFAQADPDAERDELQVNVVALTELTRIFLKGMLERGKGRILNVASTAAFQPGPLMAVYYASKSYVLHFSEAIANELRGSGVTVTVVCPGWTATRFQERAKLHNSRFVARFLTMDSATVARIAVDAMLKGKSLVIPGFRNAAIAWLVRFMPRGFIAAFARRMQDRVRV